MKSTYDGLAGRLDEHSRYLVARREDADVLVLRLPDAQTALPVFGCEEEARMFLELRPSGRWQFREMTAAELISVLGGPCAGVNRVVLDPLPSPFGGMLLDLASVGRRTFMETYLRDGGVPPSPIGPGRRRRGDTGARRVTFEKG